MIPVNKLWMAFWEGKLPTYQQNTTCFVVLLEQSSETFWLVKPYMRTFKHDVPVMFSLTFT